jgi:predicted nucleotide-binding protein/predicted RNA-binding Zn-ribbon protein involved in translation (DUF1610 family)
MSRFYDDKSWYDVMQACQNGHIITSTAKTHPEDLKKRCPKCGEETISQCPGCHAEIQGYQHIPEVAYSGPSTPPEYCHECGKPYPWTERRQHQLTQPRHKQASLTNDVFLVHGHDEEMKQAVARTLSKLDLNPIILHEQPNQGKTIIEKFEKNSDVQFAIVLLSPDDMSFTKTTSPKDARPRPRQNVVLELGYFVGKLSRERVFALKRDGNLELPTDISGVAYTLYDGAGHWRFELVRELKAVGYTVDANALL